MIMKSITTVSLCLALAGCYPALSKQGATKAEIDADNAACKYQADVATGGNPDAMSSVFDFANIFYGCLEQHGYTHQEPKP